MDNHNQKISHLKVLYHLAHADGYFSTAEAIYIQQVAERLGVSLIEIQSTDPEEPVLDLPDMEYNLFALFHRLTIIIMIDNELDETERRYCFNLGIKMGLHPNAVGEILEHVIQKEPSGASPKEIISIF